MSKIFTSNNTPLEFFIPAEEEDRAQLVDAVTKHGGKVTETTGADTIFLSKYADDSHTSVDPKFVTESIEKKKLLNTDDYKTLAGVQHLVNYLDQNKEAPKSTAPPPPAATASIAASVVADTEASPTDADREARLAAASAVGNGMFVTREDRVNLHNKNGFTSQEDEIILEEVRKHPHRRSTHKLYQEIAEKIGRHTGNSIRYRFRTHLAPHLQYVYKLDANNNVMVDDEGKPIIATDMPKTLKVKFTAKDDYALCSAIRKLLNEKETPVESDPKDLVLPGKVFDQIHNDNPHHSKAAWRDRYRKFAVNYGIDKYIAYYESEVKAGREPVEMKNFTGRHLYKSDKPKKDLDTVVGESLTQHNEQTRKKRKTTAAASTEDTANVFLAGDQNALLASNNLFESQAAAAAVAAVSNASSLGDIDAGEFLTEDLVTEKFLAFPSWPAAIDKITEIVNRNYESGDAEQLIDALYEETGIQKKFGTFIITSVCGDVVLIPKYFERFLSTGQNPPEDVHGVWSPRDDEYLKSNDPEKMEFLRRLHGQKRVDLRKSFVDDHII